MGATKSMHDWLSLLQADDTASPSDSATGEDVTPSATVATVAEPPHPSTEVVSVAYQRIFFDWAIADGTYSPRQLRKSKVVVKRWGPVQTYSLMVERRPAC
jgi:hypothetical protein